VQIIRGPEPAEAVNRLRWPWVGTALTVWGRRPVLEDKEGSGRRGGGWHWATPHRATVRRGKRTVGVDAAAHAGAVDAGGCTVVVLGCGLDVPYPRANTGLFARVLAGGGTLTSEHPPEAQPRAANFLPRNRLITASLGEFGSGIGSQFSLCWSDGMDVADHCAQQVSRTGWNQRCGSPTHSANLPSRRSTSTVRPRRAHMSKIARPPSSAMCCS
jgi:hypothetical protein